jgi:hypothetical protein
MSANWMDDEAAESDITSVEPMRQFFLGLLIGIVIGAAGAMIYAEWEDGPDEDAAAAEQAPADLR